MTTAELLAAAPAAALPDGWRRARLGEVCEINPRRPAGLSRDADAPTSFVPMAAVDEVHGCIPQLETRSYSEVRKGYTYFADGDVLFAKITPCMQNGKHAIAGGLIDGIGFGSTEFHVIRPSAAITSEWAHYYVRQPSVLWSAEQSFVGTAGQQRVPDSFLAELEIPLPPLPQQRRIAAALSEQLAAVERARAAAAAQVEAAKALPAAFLRAVFDSDEARAWPVRRLGDCGEVVGGLQKQPSRKPRQFHRPYLTVRNVQHGWLDLGQVEEFEVTPGELHRLHLCVGDLLIVEGNGSLDHIGRNAIYEGLPEECIHQNHLIRVRLQHERVAPEFASAFLNSPAGRTQLIEKARTSSGLYTLSVSKVEQLDVPLPALERQRELIGMLAQRREATIELASALESVYGTLTGLPAALLREAFSGRM